MPLVTAERRRRSCPSSDFRATAGNGANGPMTRGPRPPILAKLGRRKPVMRSIRQITLYSSLDGMPGARLGYVLAYFLFNRYARAPPDVSIHNTRQAEEGSSRRRRAHVRGSASDTHLRTRLGSPDDAFAGTGSDRVHSIRPWRSKSHRPS